MLKVMGNIKYGAYSCKEGYERRDSMRKDRDFPYREIGTGTWSNVNVL